MPSDAYWPDIDLLHNRRVREFGSSSSGLIVMTLVIILVLALASLFHLMQVTQGAATHHRINELATKKRELVRQRSELQYQIAQQTELSRIKERARRLGYVPAEEAEVEHVSYNAPQIREQPRRTATLVSDNHSVQRTAGEAAVNGSLEGAGGWWEAFIQQIARWTASKAEALTPE